LIIPLIAGLIGGNAAGAALENLSLGAIGNTIAGAVGGVGLAQILGMGMAAAAQRWPMRRRPPRHQAWIPARSSVA